MKLQIFFQHCLFSDHKTEVVVVRLLTAVHILTIDWVVHCTFSSNNLANSHKHPICLKGGSFAGHVTQKIKKSLDGVGESFLSKKEGQKILLC